MAVGKNEEVGHKKSAVCLWICHLKHCEFLSEI